MFSAPFLARSATGAIALALLAACGSDNAVTPNATFDIGQSQAQSGPRTVTLTAGASGADYSVVVVNTAAPAGAAESFTLRGVGLGASASLAGVGSPSLALVPAEDGTSSGGELGRAFEARMRARERTVLTPLFGAARAWRSRFLGASASAGGAARSLAVDPTRRDASLPSNAKVGDILTLNVNGNDPCSNAIYHPVRVVAVGTHAIVMADTLNPAGGFTSTDYDRYAAKFDTLIFPLDSAAFGAPTDIDANGHIGLVFTRTVNELTPRNSSSYVGGFTFSRDLFPVSGSSRAQSCPASNEGEYFYLLAPDPAGVVNGNVRTTGFVDSNTTATIAHEFQHLINAGRRLYVNNADSFEETWLDEGLAHSAEELLFYRESGMGPRSNLDTPAIRSSERARGAFNLDMLGNAGRYRNYLAAPSSSSPYADNDSLSTRGATWSLLRYLVDRTSGGDNAFFFRLVNSTSTGYANLRAAYGGDLSVALRDWSTSNAVDDVAATTAELQQPSWNWHSIYAVLSSSYPLKTQLMTEGASYPGSVVAGGAAFFRLTVPASGSATLTLADQSATAATNLQLVVVRTR